MGQTEKVLELFYEHPRRKFTVREIEKRTKVPKSTVQRYLKEFGKKGLVFEGKASVSEIFRIKKANFYIEKIVESGLLKHIEDELKPDCVMLFGSFRKGESEKESDIDLYVETHEKKHLHLDKFERKLKHPIDLHVHESIDKLHENLKINVVNGIKLSGFLHLKCLTGTSARKTLSEPSKKMNTG